jgi:sugar-specific transcriptional regulator TrmB
MDIEALINLGLSKEEADIYLSLLNKGEQGASELSKSTKVKRTYIYSVSASLIKKGLISQVKKGKTTVFNPMSPDKLLTLAHEKKQKAEQAEQTLEAILPNLKTKYEVVDNKPVVTYFEGIEGIKKVYKDILNTNEDILLYRSIYDDKNTDIDTIVLKQIEEQVKRGIKTRTITPLEKTTKNIFLNFDKSRLVERHIVRSSHLDLPAQIIIYGTKVALISLRKEIIVTLLDNLDISNTLRENFELIWELSEGDHKEITSGWIK